MLKMSMENNSSHVGEYLWNLDQMGTPKYHHGPEENEPAEEKIVIASIVSMHMIYLTTRKNQMRQ
jgi:hypothetical protein